MKYNITYSCGHDGVVDLIGPGKDRENKLAWYESKGLCPECYKVQAEKDKADEAIRRQEENEAAAANAVAMGLPNLIGTEKQITWATTIRQSFLDKALMANPNEKGRQLINHIISSILNASEWIDTRDESMENRLRRYFHVFMEPASTIVDEKELAAESTLQPEKSRHSGVVVITIKPDQIRVSYTKDEDFRLIVRSLGFEWDPDSRHWFRKITVRTGSAANRAAELGNKLLVNGFSVQITDPEVRDMSVSGNFEPECKRWITLFTGGDYKGNLAINWEKGNEEVYTKARSIKGSRWTGSAIAVPVSQYPAILDFAEMMGFKISPMAEEAIQTYRNSVKIVTPVKPVDPEQVDKLAEILKSNPDVLDDLKDD